MTCVNIKLNNGSNPNGFIKVGTLFVDDNANVYILVLVEGWISLVNIKNGTNIGKEVINKLPYSYYVSIDDFVKCLGEDCNINLKMLKSVDIIVNN